TGTGVFRQSVRIDQSNRQQACLDHSARGAQLGQSHDRATTHGAVGGKYDVPGPVQRYRSASRSPQFLPALLQRRPELRPDTGNTERAGWRAMKLTSSPHPAIIGGPSSMRSACIRTLAAVLLLASIAAPGALAEAQANCVQPTSQQLIIYHAGSLNAAFTPV